MSKRMVLIACLTVVLLAAMSVFPITDAAYAAMVEPTGIDNYMGIKGTCNPGWCWLGMYDFSQGAWFDYKWQAPGLWDIIINAFEYSRWYGFYIYDDGLGTWEGANYFIFTP